MFWIILVLIFWQIKYICQEQEIKTAHLESMQCLWHFLITSYWVMLNGEFVKLMTFFCWLLPSALQHIDSSISGLALPPQPDPTSCSLSCVEECGGAAHVLKWDPFTPRIWRGICLLMLIIVTKIVHKAVLSMLILQRHSEDTCSGLDC